MSVSLNPWLIGVNLFMEQLALSDSLKPVHIHLGINSRYLTVLLFFCSSSTATSEGLDPTGCHWRIRNEKIQGDGFLLTLPWLFPFIPLLSLLSSIIPTVAQTALQVHVITGTPFPHTLSKVPTKASYSPHCLCCFSHLFTELKNPAFGWFFKGPKHIFTLRFLNSLFVHCYFTVIWAFTCFIHISVQPPSSQKELFDFL